MSELSDPIILKNIITTISPLIKSVVDNFVTPKILSLKERFKLDYNKYHIPTEEHFSEYFHRTYKKLSILNTLVFNNSQRILKDVYIPLTISENRESKGMKLDSFPTDLLEKHEKILITDTAGMGKSTLMKRFFLDIIDNKIGVPIFIELRRLSESKTIIQEIHEQINSIDKEFNEQLLLEFISEGGFIFIFDGYDEISIKERQVVTKDIQEFINKAGNNKFVLTSRPENSLASFGAFQSFQIHSLKKKEAFELLRKYDKQGSVSSLLITKLEDKNMSNIEEFLTNPLLVSLLFLAFQYKQTIPFKKHLFYRQVYDANFESHDLTKGESYTHDKYTKLEVDDFHRVLRYVGFQCFKGQKLEYTKDEILKVISKGKKFCIGLDFKESAFLKDLTVTVPLFTMDGNYYRWAHKSLQEYFAAQFIYLDINKKSEFLVSLYNNIEFGKFINVIDLFYDMDFKTFRNVILYEYLKDYREYFTEENLCYEESVPDHLRAERKELCFNKRIIFMRTRDLILTLPDFIYRGVTANALDRGLHCVIYTKYQALLNTILFRNKHELIRIINTGQTFTNNWLRMIHDRVYKSKSPGTGRFDITICNGNSFNTSKHFQKGNDIIRSVMDVKYVIDFEKAMDLLSEIEADLNDDDYQSILLD